MMKFVVMMNLKEELKEWRNNTVIDELINVLEELDVIYNGKKRNIEKLTEESNNISNQFNNADTNNLLYKDYLRLKDRQSYINKRLPIETNELKGLEIARKILLQNTNNNN